MRRLLTVASLSFAAAALSPVATGAQAPGAATIAVVDHTFWIPAGGTIDVAVRLDGERPDGAELFVEVYPQIEGDATLFDRAAAGQFDTGAVAPGPVIYPLDAEPFIPDAAGRLDVSIPTFVERGDQQLGTVRLAVAGVYPVRLSVRDADTNTTLTQTTTFVVRLPDGPPAPGSSGELATALVVPLDAPPATPAKPQAPVDLDPSARERWSAVLGALADHPDVALTLVPRPETVAALARSSTAEDGALAAALDGVVDPGAAGGRQVLAPPFVDVDAAALVASGLGSELTGQLDLGATSLAEGLGVRPDRRTWLAAPDLDAPTARQLELLAVDQWLVPAGALAPTETAEPVATRATRVAVGDEILDDVALPDADLSALLAGEGGRAAGIRLLAELTHLWFQAPEADRSGRGVVLVTPPEWTPDPELVATVLGGLTDSPLLEPVTIDRWFAGVDSLRGDDGAPLVRTLVPSAPPDLGALRDVLDSGHSQLLTLASFLPAGTDALEVERLGLRLAVAASADLGLDERDPYVTQITDRVDVLKEAVPRIGTETITLTSREATLTVTLENELAEPVVTLVTLSSSKLSITEPSRPVALEPGASTAVAFPVEARSTGAFGLTIRVGSPDGQILMREARWTIRSTAVPGVGWVLSIGGLVFLGGWWISHARKDRRAHRAAIDATAARHPSAHTP